MRQTANHACRPKGTALRCHIKACSALGPATSGKRRYSLLLHAIRTSAQRSIGAEGCSKAGLSYGMVDASSDQGEPMSAHPGQLQAGLQLPLSSEGMYSANHRQVP